VDTETFDICGDGMLECPLASGSKYKVKVKQPVPPGIPEGVKAMVFMNVVSADGTALSCLDAQIAVGSAGREDGLIGKVRVCVCCLISHILYGVRLIFRSEISKWYTIEFFRVACFRISGFYMPQFLFSILVLKIHFFQGK
jgi:hypothetical protein